jgi:hypothetical protein
VYGDVRKEALTVPGLKLGLGRNVLCVLTLFSRSTFYMKPLHGGQKDSTLSYTVAVFHSGCQKGSRPTLSYTVPVFHSGCPAPMIELPSTQPGNSAELSFILPRHLVPK